MTSVKAPATPGRASCSGTAATADLPRAKEIERAFKASAAEHPVLVAASGLVSQHRFQAQARRLTYDPSVDDHVVAAATRQVNAAEAARAVLIDQIDVWVATRVSGSRAELLHTETLGQVIDRLAELWIRWQLLAHDERPTVQAQSRIALHQSSELATAYDDLISDLHAGRRQLPIYQTPTGPTLPD